MKHRLEIVLELETVATLAEALACFRTDKATIMFRQDCGQKFLDWPRVANVRGRELHDNRKGNKQARHQRKAT